jgi:hypothetical protein
MGGDLGGGKKEGKRGIKGDKKPPPPQSGLLRGTRLGSFKKSFPRGEKFHSSLVPGRPDSKSGRNPTGSAGTGLCPCSGPSSRLPHMGAVFTAQPSWAVAGGGRLASRYVGGEKDPHS